MKTKSTIENILSQSIFGLKEAIKDYKKADLSEDTKLIILRQVKELGAQVIKLGDELLKDL